MVSGNGTNLSGINEMTYQQHLFNTADIPSADDAANKREIGITKSSEHSGEDWLEYAKDFMIGYCTENEYIFCDDIWKAGLEKPESPRAFGAVMRHALRNNWIIKTDQARPSVQSNLSLRMVYKSLIYLTD